MNWFGTRSASLIRRQGNGARRKIRRRKMSKLQVKTKNGWMTVCESTFNIWKGGPGTWRILKNEKGSAGVAKLIVLGIVTAIWFMMAANYSTPSVASDLAAHKTQIEQMLEVK